jgi:hypothetical protein
MCTYGLSLVPPYPWRTRLLAYRSQLTPALPHTGHRLPPFVVRDVQVPLRLLDVSVAEHQLDGADVHLLREEATGALVAQVVPVQVDLPELRAIRGRRDMR